MLQICLISGLTPIRNDQNLGCPLSAQYQILSSVFLLIRSSMQSVFWLFRERIQFAVIGLEVACVLVLSWSLMVMGLLQGSKPSRQQLQSSVLVLSSWRRGCGFMMFRRVMCVIFIGGKYYLLILLMAKANSFKTEPWTALEKGEVSIFEDDYVHDKLFTFKTTRKAATSSIALKETLTQKDGKITSAEELKFWFPFRDTRTLYARIKNDGFKLHYDHGVLTQNDYRFNLYASAQGKRNFGSLVYKLGLETQNNDLLFNWRLRYNQGDSLSLANKTTYTQPKWSLGLVNNFDLTAQQWNHSAAQLAWKHCNINFYLKANGNGSKKYERVNPRTFLETVSFHAIEKLTDNTKLGLELNGNLVEKEVTNAAVAWDHRCSSTANTGIRVKADLKRNLSFSIKNSLHDYGSYIFGVHVHEFGGANRFSYGIQLDLTL